MATVATQRDPPSAYGEARSTIDGAPLEPEELRLIDAYWRASLYLCLVMIYLKDNPLLLEPLALDHLKARLPFTPHEARGLPRAGSADRPVAARVVRPLLNRERSVDRLEWTHENQPVDSSREDRRIS